MPINQSMPKDKGLDHTLAVLKEGYLYIGNRAEEFQSDVFQTRLLGEEAICLRGKEGAELFYDENKFIRDGAAPNRLVKTLFGEGGVQSLDGAPHKHRKAMFMSLMTREALKEIREITKQEWERSAKHWENQDEITLYLYAQEILFRTSCRWAGIPLLEDEVAEKSSWQADMFEAAASVGPNHWQGRRARTKTENWIERLVQEVRDGKLVPNEETALHQISWHKDENGELLDTETAAVEIVNIIRPIVAIAVYICFTALAVHQHPEKAREIEGSDENQLKYFAQEVRRFYPFFPFTAARVKKTFEWNNYTFKEGTLALLDLYGTNHHPDLWDHPDVFKPERFKTWDQSPFNFIPQGGGDYDTGHRCAGEWLTVEVLKESLDYLGNKMTYSIPDQDLGFSFNDIPSLPQSKIVMQEVKLK